MTIMVVVVIIIINHSYDDAVWLSADDQNPYQLLHYTTSSVKSAAVKEAH